jgi:arsenical pump membrane protein
MGALAASPWTIWGIAALTAAGVVLRPFAWPEFIWAVTGAGLVTALGVLPPADALAGVLKGTDVYLFLIGMMLLAELARQEGLFDWLAARAAVLANGSATRLFALVFAVGTVVTVFLSNDATAVVLTPAVAAVVRTAEAKEPLPYLFICAFIANAASFVLPISNPANLVIYGSHMPPLLHWLPMYALPSVLSIVATYGVLRWTQRKRLREPVASGIEVPPLTLSGKLAAAGIAATAVVLLAASGFDVQLGLPTFLAGAATAIVVLIPSRSGPVEVVKGISWGVLPLVAGLFVLVEALGKTGVTADLAALLGDLVRWSATGAAWVAGAVLAVGCNLVNNLPAGLLAGRVAEAAAVPEPVRAAVLIGVDLGPNLSVTGSLATILWLTALRREGLRVSAWSFLKLGALAMPPALLLAIAGAFGVSFLEGGLSMKGLGAVWLYPVILIAGVLQAWGPPMNGALRNALTNPWLASLVSFLPIVALLGVMLVCMPRPLPTVEGVSGMPWWAPLGGLAGAFAVIAGLLFVDKVGAAAFAGLTITANILMSLAIDQFGLFGMPVHHLGIWRVVGGALMVGGIALVALF